MKETIAQANEIVRNLTRHPFEIYYLRKRQESIESKNEVVDGYESATTEGISIRILEEDKIGFAYSTQLDEKGLLQMTRKAIESIGTTPADTAFTFLPPPPSCQALPILDPSLKSLTAETKRAMVISIEQAARAFDPRIKQIRNAQLSIRQVTINLFNSLGLDLSCELSGVTAAITLTAEENGQSEYGWESQNSHFLSDIDFKKVGEQAARKALAQLGGIPVPGGSFPAILDREVAAELISVLIPSFSGENLYKGKTSLAEKEGQKIFSGKITLKDGLLFTGGMAAAPFDGEGTPAQETTLVESGVLTNFFRDTFYGKKLGRPSTGNARRGGISSLPSCGATNIVLTPGDSSLETMTKSIAEGFFIRDLMGVHTANPITGDFSLGASGQWIKNGVPAHPVRGVAVSGNIFDLFQKVEAVGNDLQWFGTVGVPHLLIGDLTIAGN
jgi:PmbA protein